MNFLWPRGRLRLRVGVRRGGVQRRTMNNYNPPSPPFSKGGMGGFGRMGSMWRNWVTGLLGIWLIVASFTMNGTLLNQLIVGIAVAILGFWTAVQG